MGANYTSCEYLNLQKLEIQPSGNKILNANGEREIQNYYDNLGISWISVVLAHW